MAFNSFQYRNRNKSLDPAATNLSDGLKEAPLGTESSLIDLESNASFREFRRLKNKFTQISAIFRSSRSQFRKWTFCAALHSRRICDPLATSVNEAFTRQGNGYSRNNILRDFYYYLGRLFEVA